MVINCQIKSVAKLMFLLQQEVKTTYNESSFFYLSSLDCRHHHHQHQQTSFLNQFNFEIFSDCQDNLFG